VAVESKKSIVFHAIEGKNGTAIGMIRLVRENGSIISGLLTNLNHLDLHSLLRTKLKNKNQELREKYLYYYSMENKGFKVEDSLTGTGPSPYREQELSILTTSINSKIILSTSHIFLILWNDGTIILSLPHSNRIILP
jgi:hypothetical protein